MGKIKQDMILVIFFAEGDMSEPRRVRRRQTPIATGSVPHSHTLCHVRAATMVRKLRHHEQKLLKKVDFLAVRRPLTPARPL